MSRPSPRVRDPRPTLLTVVELAAWLRIKERKVYDLVAKGELPHTRAGSKILFASAEVERWLAGRSAGGGVRSPVPATIAGSHDPLLEWAVRESRCGLALLTLGSMDGIERLVAGEASAALVHLPAPDLADFNRHVAEERLRGRNMVLVEWARCEQGLIVANGNPHKLRVVGDLGRRGIRVALRQEGSGSRALLERLLAHAGRKSMALRTPRSVFMTESDLAAAIQRGEADVGLGARAVSKVFGLDFVALIEERLDLAIARAAWFDPPMQALWSFARTARFAKYAASLPGYELSAAGSITWNDHDSA